LAFCKSLAARIRHILTSKSAITEKKLFGGLCLLLNGKMLVGVWKDSLMARLGPDQGDKALQQSHVKKLDIAGKQLEKLA